MSSSLITALMSGLLIAVACLVLWSYSVQFPSMTRHSCVNLDQVSHKSMYYEIYTDREISSVVCFVVQYINYALVQWQSPCLFVCVCARPPILPNPKSPNPEKVQSMQLHFFYLKLFQLSKFWAFTIFLLCRIRSYLLTLLRETSFKHYHMYFI